MRHVFFSILALTAPICFFRSHCAQGHCAHASEWNSLLQRVVSALNSSPVGDYTTSLDVMVRHETVWLRGAVPSLEVKELAVAVAQEVPGVSFVVDELSVAASISPRLPKRQIDKTKIHAILDRVHSLKLDSRFDIEIYLVEESLVVEGTVGSDHDKHEILATIRQSSRPLEVRDKLSVITVDADTIRTSIDKILASFPLHVTSGLSYTVQDGTVQFEGSVSEHRDIDAILSDVLMIDGVRNVLSSVKITTEKR